MTRNNNGWPYRLGQVIAVIAVATLSILFVLMCFGAIKAIWEVIF